MTLREPGHRSDGTARRQQPDMQELPHMLTTDALRQMVDQNHESAEEGHLRLRSDYRSLEGRMQAVETAQVSNALHLGRLDAAVAEPTEVSALRFTPQMVVAIVLVCASIIGGMYGATASLRVSQQEIASQLTLQSRMQEERMQALKLAIEALQRAQEASQRLQQLQQYEIQAMKETLIKQGRKAS